MSDLLEFLFMMVCLYLLASVLPQSVWLILFSAPLTCGFAGWIFGEPGPELTPRRMARVRVIGFLCVALAMGLVTAPWVAVKYLSLSQWGVIVVLSLVYCGAGFIASTRHHQ